MKDTVIKRTNPSEINFGDKVCLSDGSIVTINSGQYLSNGRVSNFWHWTYENGSSGHGYGFFYSVENSDFLSGLYRTARILHTVNYS